MTSKTAIIPTMPSRIEYLKNAVESIIDQVDTLYIYLNNFMHVPDFLLGRDKIINIIGKDWGSAGRFFICDKVKGYLTFLDDDLIYPDDFIEKSIEKIEQYERKAIITLHGRILKPDLYNWIVDQQTIVRCLYDWQDDIEVHVAGTGVMSYHSDTLQISLNDFKNRNLDDVEFSILSQKQNIPIVAVNHEKGYLINQDKVRKGYTIWNETVRNPKPLVLLARSIQWGLFGIKTNNKGILLKAKEILPEKPKEDKEVIVKEENIAQKTWREKMSNLMRRRKERKGKPKVIRNNSDISRYDQHISRIKVGTRVLDVGCGSMVIKKFLPPEIDYLGIDAYPVSPEVVKMEIEKANYPDKWFDTIFAFAVLDSVYDLDKALEQIARMARKNVLILTGLNIEPNEFHTFEVTEDKLKHSFRDFKEGYRESFGPNVALIEYVRESK